MGVYKKAVITNAGRALLARSMAGEIVMQFSRAVTSSHIYPSDTDFKGYTSLEGIQQTVIPSNVQVVNDTLISVRGLFSNESISESYLIQNIGLYATDGVNEVLFSVSQATTPDEMPAYNGVAPSSFIYTIQATVSQASSLSLTINPAGTATTQDIMDLDDVKLDRQGDVSETVVETLETVEDKFPIPSAGEKIKQFLGKVLTFLKNIKPLEADVTYYVATTGSDFTGDGTSAKPFKTIQRAVDTLPRDLGGHTAVVSLADGTYAENILIAVSRNGVLYINGNESNNTACKINGSIRVVNSKFVGIRKVEITGPSLAAINAQRNEEIYIEDVTITTTSENPGIYLGNVLWFDINQAAISNRNIGILADRSNGMVTSISGSNNSIAIDSRFGSSIKFSGTQTTITGNSTRFLTETAGCFIQNNGTQISGIISSGLSCTWGTLTGGYVRHGNTAGGTAMVTIQIRVVLTTSLTSETSYVINGFPSSSSIIAVTCSAVSSTNQCSMNTSGQIIFTPSTAVASGSALNFNATYATNS